MIQTRPDIKRFYCPKRQNLRHLFCITVKLNAHARFIEHFAMCRLGSGVHKHQINLFIPLILG
jgi:hypothetical protein